MMKGTRKLLIASAVASALAAPAAALAQATPAPAPAEKAKSPVPGLDEVLEATGITVNGYIDATYSYLNGNGAFTSGSPNRVFDDQHSSFQLNQAAITIAKQPAEGFGGLVNLTAGTDANVIAPFPTNPGASSNFDVTQAFAQYAHGPLTVIAGKYVTLAGAEVINPTQDVNISRSILFGFAIPFTHTGARATYAVNDKVSLIGGINNGWDDLQDTNTQKTGEVGVALTPIKAVTINLTDYFGTEQVGGLTKAPPSGARNLVDLVAAWTATDKLTLTFNYDYGTQDNASAFTTNAASKAKWWGFALYGTYQFNDEWRLSVRGEKFDDDNGYRTGVAQRWSEATATVSYLAGKHFEMRGEIRDDWSNQSSFVSANGSSNSKHQASAAVEAIYKF